MQNAKSKTKTFNECVESYNDGKKGDMGYISSYVYWHDPVRVAISVSRYKFVSKMMSGLDKVLELSCADAFYSQIVADRVGTLVASDFDELFIGQAKELGRAKNMELRVLDLTKEPCENEFDGVYALDVLEHIHPKDEDAFMRNITRALKKNGADSVSGGGGGGGIAIFGIPSLESQVYASRMSKLEHINCKNGDELKKFCQKYFHHCFVFSMNDEVVHTGFYLWHIIY